MGKPGLIDGLSDDERVLLGEALRALRRERGPAWNAACDAAEAHARRRPSIRGGSVCDRAGSWFEVFAGKCVPGFRRDAPEDEEPRLAE